MSIRPEYNRFLDHLGVTVTLRELDRDRDRRDAVALRHDVDYDLDLALEMAHAEHARGMRATYFLLHTAEYWQDPLLDRKCAQLEAYGHEVGLHLNVITEWVLGRCRDADQRIALLLARLREGGVEVAGTSAHGDRACYEHAFINSWVWRELRGTQPEIDHHGLSAEGIPVPDPEWQIPYPVDHRVHAPDGRVLQLWSSSLASHGLAYDATRVPHDHYWTDSGGAWKRSGDPLEADLSHGRHQVLVHPYWWRGPKRTYVVLSTAAAGAGWLASFIDRATSCRGLHEGTLRPAASGGELDAGEPIEGYAGLIEDDERSLALVRDAAAHMNDQPGDVAEVGAYLEPFIEKVREMMPGAGLVHLHRDGRDVVRAIMSRGWYDRLDEPRYPVPVKRWESMGPLERACAYWDFTQRRIMTFTDERICFEKAIADGPYLRDALARLGIVVHPLLAAEAPPPPEPAGDAAFAPFREWAADARDAFERICGPVRKALGYGGGGKARAPVSRRVANARRRGRAVFELDPGASPRQYGSDGVTLSKGRDGLVVRPTRGGSAVAHALLARGTWSRVQPRHGVACDENVYYACSIAATVLPDVRVRVFVLFFDAAGRRIDKRHGATLNPGSGDALFTFRAAPGSHHFALAARVDRRGGEQVTIHAVSVRAFALHNEHAPVRVAG